MHHGHSICTSTTLSIVPIALSGAPIRILHNPVKRLHRLDLLAQLVAFRTVGHDFRGAVHACLAQRPVEETDALADDAQTAEHTCDVLIARPSGDGSRDDVSGVGERAKEVDGVAEGVERYKSGRLVEII